MEIPKLFDNLSRGYLAGIISGFGFGIMWANNFIGPPSSTREVVGLAMICLGIVVNEWRQNKQPA